MFDPSAIFTALGAWLKIKYEKLMRKFRREREINDKLKEASSEGKEAVKNNDIGSMLAAAGKLKRMRKRKR